MVATIFHLSKHFSSSFAAGPRISVCAGIRLAWAKPAAISQLNLFTLDRDLMLINLVPLTPACEQLVSKRFL